jgi:hypothetical protein
MSGRFSNVKRGALVAALGSFALVGASSVASAGLVPAVPLNVSQILRGSSFTHTFTPSNSSSPMTESLSNIDDLTQLGDELFVVFQNGVGPNGEASTSRNLDSTVVELTTSGQVLGQWDVAGRTDGVVADLQLRGVIATVNEDGNSSLFVIQPHAVPASQITHYAYDAGLTHGGGTDSLALVDGQLLISASNPGTPTKPAPNAALPAVYVAQLDVATKVAKLTPLFSDEDAATVANLGSTYATTTHLALTDPDSSTLVPESAARFGGTFELTSQGDQQQIFVRHATTTHQSLSVLSLSQSVDDTAYATSREGRLFSTDSTNNSVDVLSGHFSTIDPYTVATPCNANSAPSGCTTSNYLATIDPWTGMVTPVRVAGAAYTPKGALIFVTGNNRGKGYQVQGQHAPGR